MMEATDFGNPDDPAELRRLDRPSVGCVLVEREVSTCPIIVGEVRGQDASQMPLTENYDMLRALASHRPDEPLDERVLPGLCGAVRTSLILIPFIRCRNRSP